MSRYKALKQQVLECNKDIEKYNLAIFTWGNVSAVDRVENCMAIKPSSCGFLPMSAE